MDNPTSAERGTQTQLIPQPPKASDIWQGYVASHWTRPYKVIGGRGYNALPVTVPNPQQHLAYGLRLVSYKAGLWTIGCIGDMSPAWAERQLRWLARDLADYVRQTYGAEVAYRVTFTAAPAATLPEIAY